MDEKKSNVLGFFQLLNFPPNLEWLLWVSYEKLLDDH